MDRYIEYTKNNQDINYYHLYFAYRPTHKEIKNSISNLIKDGNKNIKVIKTKYTKCICKKCGNIHQIPRLSKDETFTEFINTNLEKK